MFITEKVLPINGPVQFKYMLFNRQCITLVKANKVSASMMLFWALQV